MVIHQIGANQEERKANKMEVINHMLVGINQIMVLCERHLPVPFFFFATTDGVGSPIQSLTSIQHQQLITIVESQG